MMKPYFYEGVLEKECMKQLLSCNGNYGEEYIRANVIIIAKYRRNEKHPTVLLYDLTVIDKTRSDSSPRHVAVRISPKGFRYQLSHHYKESDQSAPYILGREGTNNGSIEEACHYAAMALFMEYRLGSNDSAFVPDKYYKD